jgi:geranylgeranyl diphosphate synthase type I
MAFQIRDDLLGIYGSEEEVGKPVTSDLEEGKETLLTVFARAHGNREQRHRIASLVGKHPITADELNDARKIFRDIGAVAHCEERAQELVRDGEKALEDLHLREDIAALLTELADHVISRTT